MSEKNHLLPIIAVIGLTASAIGFYIADTVHVPEKIQPLVGAHAVGSVDRQDVTSTLKNPTHVFTTAGPHLVTLTVCNGIGCAASSQCITVHRHPSDNVLYDDGFECGSLPWKNPTVYPTPIPTPTPTPTPPPVVPLCPAGQCNTFGICIATPADQCRTTLGSSPGACVNPAACGGRLSNGNCKTC